MESVTSVQVGRRLQKCLFWDDEFPLARGTCQPYLSISFDEAVSISLEWVISGFRSASFRPSSGACCDRSHD